MSDKQKKLLKLRWNLTFIPLVNTITLFALLEILFRFYGNRTDKLIKTTLKIAGAVAVISGLYAALGTAPINRVTLDIIGVCMIYIIPFAIDTVLILDQDRHITK